MLFLAVFCGFLAEYQLKHKIEKNRERQFIVSMIEDLKADTGTISILNGQRSGRFRMYDSLSSAITGKNYSENEPTFIIGGEIFLRKMALELIDFIKKNIIFNRTYGSTCTYSHRKKKMDPLFLGVSYVVFGSVLWFPRRI